MSTCQPARARQARARPSVCSPALACLMRLRRRCSSTLPPLRRARTTSAPPQSSPRPIKSVCIDKRPEQHLPPLTDQAVSKQCPPAMRRRRARAQAHGPCAAQGGPGSLPRLAAARHSCAGPGRAGAAHDGRARECAARGGRGHAQGIYGHARGRGGPPAPRVDRDAPAGAGLGRRGGGDPAAAVARPAAHERRRRRRHRRLVAGPES